MCLYAEVICDAGLGSLRKTKKLDNIESKTHMDTKICESIERDRVNVLSCSAYTHRVTHLVLCLGNRLT